ncbi:MAG: integrase arm-type DNA-binding domain-containing protein [Caenibius sp.]
MPTGKITKRSVDSMKPDSRDVFLWDTDCRGFGVKRTPAGKAVFLIQYRLHGGRGSKTKRYTIGPMGVWTPDSARDEAERLLRKVAQGIDPGNEKKRKRLEAKELAFDVYADRFLKLQGGKKWSDRTEDFMESIVRLHLKPAFSDLPLPSLTASDVTRFLDQIPKNSPSVRRNCFSVLQRLLRWARGRGDITINPLEGFEAPPVLEGRDRVLGDDELKLLFSASEKLPSPFGGFIRLLALTGQRRNEVAGMDWRELNRNKREWLVPSSRAKNGVENLLPLPDLVITELDALASSDNWPKRGLVFTTTGKTPVSGFSKCKRTLDAAMLKELQNDDEKAEIEPWRLHDLRRSMATHMQRLRISGDVIEACENRKAGRSKPGSARVYQRHDYGPEKREAMDKWGGFLTALLADDDNVVPLVKAS